MEKLLAELRIISINFKRPQHRENGTVKCLAIIYFGSRKRTLFLACPVESKTKILFDFNFVVSFSVFSLIIMIPETEE